MNKVTEAEIDNLVKTYGEEYEVASDAKTGEGATRVREQARMELGMKKFLEDGSFGAYTDTFQDLHGLPQLPARPSPVSASWPEATASAPRATGRPPASSA